MGLRIKEQSFLEDSMVGLFMIVKGQYRKTAPSVTCRDGEDRFIGGYNPESEDTSEWYQLMDRVTYVTISCGSSLEQMTNCITRTIIHHKNDRNSYLATKGHNIYEDDAGTLSHRVLVSPITKMLMEKVEEFYGDYYDDIIKEAEDKALEELSNKSKSSPKKLKTIKSTPVKKGVLKKTNKDVVVEEEEFPFISESKPKVKKTPLKKKTSTVNKTPTKTTTKGKGHLHFSII